MGNQTHEHVQGQQSYRAGVIRQMEIKMKKVTHDIDQATRTYFEMKIRNKGQIKIIRLYLRNRYGVPKIESLFEKAESLGQEGLDFTALGVLYTKRFPKALPVSCITLVNLGCDTDEADWLFVPDEWKPIGVSFYETQQQTKAARTKNLFNSVVGRMEEAFKDLPANWNVQIGEGKAMFWLNFHPTDTLTFWSSTSSPVSSLTGEQEDVEKAVQLFLQERSQRKIWDQRLQIVADKFGDKVSIGSHQIQFKEAKAIIDSMEFDGKIILYCFRNEGDEDWVFFNRVEWTKSAHPDYSYLFSHIDFANRF